MKCKLCQTSRALVKVKIGEAIIEVCLYCAILEHLEVIEVVENVWEEEERSVKDCLEKGNQD